MYPQQYPASAPLPVVQPNEMGYNSLQQATGFNDSDERLRKFQYLVDRYEINREFATRLRVLEGYEIVFIVDGKLIKKIDFCTLNFSLSNRGENCNTIKLFSG